ncbi:DUF262 domain-containing protein [Syntrophotalea acetylenica]|uniref:DUF262 domain-containing protein n=1 Tax=Syntrophotalea acetylenica TaxID=29542 RepID=UPI002A36E7D4|nr:DUF262 domain-containing protein [Syntrophotalea acetylenica]MDY0262716.1 DUF262 domain-containing protein [Syntrophotalea acetylenica]
MRNQNETIRKMVSYLNNPEKDGGFWLPNIQRPFVWREDQIERLFDSIMREYPISTLLVWRTKSPIKRRKFIDNYKHGLRLFDFYVPEDDKNKLLVLDGQQRLQSLFIGLKGSYEKKEMYFDVLSGDLVAPEDVRYGFRFLEGEKAGFPWIKFKDLVFSNDMPNKVADGIIIKAQHPLSDQQKNRIMDNVWKVFQTFAQNEVLTYQELDSVDNPKAYSEDDVVEIFIRANSGGTKLGKSDLLFSLLIGSWEDADEHMGELLDELNRTGYGFTRDFILKSCLTLLGKGARYDVQKFRDGSTKESIISRWKDISAAIRDVKDFLYGKTFIRSDRALPSYLGLIPIIYFRFNYPDQWKSVKGLDNYILRTLITGAFSGTPDNLIDRCTKVIDDLKTFDVGQLFGVIKADGRSLEITRDTIFDLQYGSKDIHLLFNLWYRDFNYIPAFVNNQPQVDHIFPQSILKTVKEINPETGKRNMLRYTYDIRDQLANCMLLTAQENGAGGKSDTPPEKWFQDKSAEYLEMHLIPKDQELWNLENFERFVEERKRLILEKFTYMLVKEEGSGSNVDQAVA